MPNSKLVVTLVCRATEHVCLTIVLTWTKSACSTRCLRRRSPHRYAFQHLPLDNSSCVTFLSAQVYQSYVKDLENYLQSFYQKVNPLIVRRRFCLSTCRHNCVHTCTINVALGLEKIGQRVRKSPFRPQIKTYCNEIIAFCMHTADFERYIKFVEDTGMKTTMLALLALWIESFGTMRCRRIQECTRVSRPIDYLFCARPTSARNAESHKRTEGVGSQMRVGELASACLTFFADIILFFQWAAWRPCCAPLFSQGSWSERLRFVVACRGQIPETATKKQGWECRRETKWAGNRTA